MTDLAPYVEYLADTPVRTTMHYGRSLLDHLITTSETLARWGHDHELQLAGLFHSYYAAVAQPTAHSRALVAEAIGSATEALIFTYATGEPTTAPVKALRCLEAANAFDLAQFAARTRRDRDVLAQHLESLMPYLTTQGSSEVKAIMNGVLA
jgi:hypothetical protein